MNRSTQQVRLRSRARHRLILILNLIWNLNLISKRVGAEIKYRGRESKARGAQVLTAGGDAQRLAGPQHRMGASHAHPRRAGEPRHRAVEPARGEHRARPPGHSLTNGVACGAFHRPAAAQVRRLRGADALLVNRRKLLRPVCNLQMREELLQHKGVSTSDVHVDEHVNVTRECQRDSALKHPKHPAPGRQMKKELLRDDTRRGALRDSALPRHHPDSLAREISGAPVPAGQRRFAGDLKKLRAR